MFRPSRALVICRLAPGPLPRRLRETLVELEQGTGDNSLVLLDTYPDPAGYADLLQLGRSFMRFTVQLPPLDYDPDGSGEFRQPARYPLRRESEELGPRLPNLSFGRDLGPVRGCQLDAFAESAWVITGRAAQPFGGGPIDELLSWPSLPGLVRAWVRQLQLGHLLPVPQDPRQDLAQALARAVVSLYPRRERQAVEELARCSGRFAGGAPGEMGRALLAHVGTVAAARALAGPEISTVIVGAGPAERATDATPTVVLTGYADGPAPSWVEVELDQRVKVHMRA